MQGYLLDERLHGGVWSEIKSNVGLWACYVHSIVYTMGLPYGGMVATPTVPLSCHFGKRPAKKGRTDYRRLKIFSFFLVPLHLSPPFQLSFLLSFFFSTSPVCWQSSILHKPDTLHILCAHFSRLCAVFLSLRLASTIPKLRSTLLIIGIDSKIPSE